MPSSRFDYVKYDQAAIDQQDVTKNNVRDVETLINKIAASPGGQRAKSLALTKLEECYMWIGKLIRDEQIARNGSAPLQEERKDG